MIVYRDSHDVDLFQLARLFETAGWIARTEDFARLSQLVRGSAIVLGAWDGDRLVGFVRAISDGAAHAYVADVSVLPEYRRQGIGKELLRRLLYSNDHLTFTLHADPKVQPFYAKCGFEPAPNMLKRTRKH